MTIELIAALGALLTGVAAIISAILINRKTQALLEYRLQQVEERLDKHNHYAEKFSDTAVMIAQIQKDIEYIKNK